MFKDQTLPIAFALLFGGLMTATAARAQTVVDPTIVLNPEKFTEIESRISLEDVEDSDHLYEFQWQIQGSLLGTYRFEITYDKANGERVRMSSSSSPRFNLNQGEILGTEVLQFKLKASEIAWPLESDVNQPLESVTRAIVVHVFQSGQQDRENPNIKSWTFTIDTRPPPPPTLLGLSPGERRLGVEWEAPSVRASDVKFYDIVYCPHTTLPANTDFVSGTSTTTVEQDCDVALACAGRAVEVKESIDNTLFSESISDDLSIGVLASVALRSKDSYANVGLCGNVLVAAPISVTDFFERSRQRGIQEDGGFCFVATAAHGSYAHPVVRLLRFFRDQFLMRTPWGAEFVEAYYRASPPLAAEIQHDASLAGWTRLALLPVAGAALLLVALPALGMASLGLVLARRRLRGRARRRLVRGATLPVGRMLWVIAFVASSSLASPDRAHAKRPEGTLPVGLGFEFKGGPYLPKVSSQVADNNSTSAFEEIFPVRPRPLFTLGLDLQLYRGFGTAGVSGSFGFMQFVGKSLIVDDTGTTRSSDTTVFNILPLDLVAFYRFDWLADQIWFPLVPYAKGGLAYHVWWVTTSIGHVSRDRGDPTTADDDAIGRGGKFGLTGTLGISILLNAFDGGSAKALFNSTGVRGTYFFAEVQTKKVNGFGGQGYDLSDTTWNLGLYLEM